MGPNSDAGQGHIAGANLASQPVSKQEWSLSIQPDPDLAISCPGSGKISWLAANPCPFICSFIQSVSICQVPRPPSSQGLRWMLHSGVL